MTQFYVGVKIVTAWPETRDGKDGYAVKYADGYVSWSPKDTFEKAYFPMGASNDSKVTPAMVSAMLSDVSAEQIDEKTALVTGKMFTGFKEYEAASCVDPANFSLATGTEIGTKRIQDRIWKLLGFVVQWGRFGLTTHEQTDR